MIMFTSIIVVHVVIVIIRKEIRSGRAEALRSPSAQRRRTDRPTRAGHARAGERVEALCLPACSASASACAQIVCCRVC